MGDAALIDKFESGIGEPGKLSCRFALASPLKPVIVERKMGRVVPCNRHNTIKFHFVSTFLMPTKNRAREGVLNT